MSNSSLVDYVRYSPNRSRPRANKISGFTIHCMAGQMTAAGCGAWFALPSTQASSQYGIGYDGSKGLYVDEGDRSWATSSRDNDNAMITIEVASENKAPYKVTDAAYKSLIELLVDCCKRNNIPKLLWKNDKSLIGKYDQQNITVHRWFASKSCPGDYLFERLPDICKQVNDILDGKQTIAAAPGKATAPVVSAGTNVEYQVKILVDDLKIRKGPGTQYDYVGAVNAGGVYTIVQESGNWGKLRSGYGWISINPKYVEKRTATTTTESAKTETPKEPAKEEKPTVVTNKGSVVSYTVKIINEIPIKLGPAASYDEVGKVTKNTVYTIQREHQNWGLLKSGAGWIYMNPANVTKSTDEKKTQATTTTTSTAKTTATTTTKVEAPTFKVGKLYKLTEELVVRFGPGTGYGKKNYKQLSISGQKCDKDKDGALDAGTQVTCKAVRTVGKDIWIQIPSGWIPAYTGGKTKITLVK